MIAHYAIEHTIRFDYDAPVHAEVMTLHLCPHRDRTQVVRDFSIRTEPDGPLLEYTDPFGNTAHFLDRPGVHERLVITARSNLEVGPVTPVPEELEGGGWEALRRTAGDAALWPMLHDSHFVRSSPALDRFVAKHGLAPGKDPIASTRRLRAELYRTFEYVPGATTAESPIETILETGRGVCQDYAHVMASVLRRWGIPCRYVSGYLAPPEEDVTRGESHAWVEGWFPGIGWTAFDPTNDTEGDERHVRVAVGRDYADVPPTRGVFLGSAGSVLETGVVIERR